MFYTTVYAIVTSGAFLGMGIHRMLQPKFNHFMVAFEFGFALIFTLTTIFLIVKF